MLAAGGSTIGGAAIGYGLMIWQMVEADAVVGDAGLSSLSVHFLLVTASLTAAVRLVMLSVGLGMQVELDVEERATATLTVAPSLGGLSVRLDL